MLKAPCKINAPPEELVPFDKGKKAAHQITPRLAALAEKLICLLSMWHVLLHIFLSAAVGICAN